MNSVASIYIPRMAAHHTEQSVRNIMVSFQVGTVVRVDFTPINKKPGFGEKVDDIVKSAFIHFSDPRPGPEGWVYFNTKSYNGNEELWEAIAAGQSYRLQVSPREYWICLMNKNPLQNTMMNIHQVVENGRHLETLIEKQNDEIKNLREIIDKQSKTIEGIHGCVYQLVGGLYCQSTQQGMLNIRLADLGFEDCDINSKNTHPSGFWPTTRQGDECERKIKELENTIREMLLHPGQARITPIFNDEEQDDYLLMRKHQNNMDCDDNSISTHSSMPELEDYSVSDDSYDRVVTSHDLCGNA
jgi:hypothetical protein